MEITRKLSNQKGAVAPLVAIMLVLIIVCVALVVDLGHIHNVKVQMQRAVDAAALAAAQQLPAGNITGVARAAAAANSVDNLTGLGGGPGGVLPVWVTGDQFVVTPGIWNDQITPGATAGSRFDDTLGADEIPNAVKVEATRSVNHVFFFFVAATAVTTDAIAVQQTELPAVPLAVISCIPSTGPQAGELTACGIQTYTFSSNTNTAGWTALTAGGKGGASRQDIEKFFTVDRKFFNDIVQLLEETKVVGRPLPFDSTFQGCEGNNGTNVICGLGGDFTSLSSLGDPLTRYNHLPRFITDNTDEVQAFRDILNQLPGDGLLRSSGETFAQYQARLQGLKDGTIPNPYGDNRFQTFVKIVKDKYDANNDGKTNDDIYVPDFNKVLDYAGYPPVAATTGSMSSVMDTLLDQVAETGQKKNINFKSQFDFEVFPFDKTGEPTSGARGETLLFFIPVIFAGSCDNFDPSSFADNDKAKVKEDNELHYVGIANYLVTRIFKGGDCYQTDTPVTITSLPVTGCTSAQIQSHQPPLLNDKFSCPATSPPVAFEALIRPPLAEEEQRALKRIVLVE